MQRLKRGQDFKPLLSSYPPSKNPPKARMRYKQPKSAALPPSFSFCVVQRSKTIINTYCPCTAFLLLNRY